MNEKFENANILVVGAGTMGASIAQVFAARGITVYLADIKTEYLAKAQQSIANNVAGLIKEGLADDIYRNAVEQNIHNITNTDIPAIGKKIDFAFEAVFESEEVKQSIYQLLNDNCRSDCIFASNTSGMDIFSVCRDVITHPDRLIIAHWFNPPYLMKLIEVVKGPQTSDATANMLRGLPEYAGKKPAVLNQFVPGFIVNRIATVINRELYSMIHQGWISGEDAETAIRYTDGLRYGFEGPLALWDFVGLDIPMTVAKQVLPSLCNDTDTLPLGVQLLEEGKSGVRAGEGVLKYPDAQKYVEKRNRRIIQMTKVLDQFDKEDAGNE